MDGAAAPVLPRHVGIIADGNRRWARQHGLPAWEGHLAGYTTLKEVLFELFEAGVEYLSIYTWSTENWQRPRPEVEKVMQLVYRMFTTDLKLFVDRGIQIRVLGIEDGLSDKLIKAIADSQAKTAHLTNGTLCVCFNYGGQREILDATRLLMTSGRDPADLTEADFAAALYAPEIPPLDMVVRTSGEHRLSNFMLWRAAYSEFLFFDKFLPDLRSEDVQTILTTYASRQRRFGG